MNYCQSYHESLSDGKPDDPNMNRGVIAKLHHLLRFATDLQRKLFLFGCLCAAARSIAILSALIVVGWIISLLVRQSSNEEVESDEFLISFFFLGLQCLILPVISYFQNCTLKQTWVRIVFNVKQLYFNAVYHEFRSSEEDVNQEYSIYDTNKKSIEIKNLDVEVGILIEGLTAIIFSFLICLSISWKLSILLIFFLIFFYSKHKVQLPLPHLGTYFTLSSKAQAFATYSIESMKAVSSFNCEDFVVMNYKTLLEAIHPYAFKIYKSSALYKGIRLTLFHFSCILAFGYAYRLYTEEWKSNFGNLFVVLSIIFLNQYYFGRVFSSLRNIEIAQKSLSFFYLKIDQFIDEKETDGIDLDFKKGNIVFDNVYSKGKDGSALRGLTLEIKRGETIGLVGKSRSGKNALYDLLNNNCLHTMGRIVVDGQRIDRISKKQLRQFVRIVESHGDVYEGTIMDNIRMNRPGITDENIKKCAEVAQLHDFICKLEHGFATDLLKNGITLSKQQKQLLGIARCIVTEPKILFLNWATSSLSDETEEKILTSLRDHMANRIIIVHSERISCLEKLDRIFVFEEGVVAEKGNHHQLIAKQGKYLDFIKKWEKKREFNPSEYSPLAEQFSERHLFLQGDRNRLSCNYRGSVKLFIGSSVFCFLRSLDKLLFLYFCYILLSYTPEKTDYVWHLLIIFIGLLIVGTCTIIQDLLAKTFSESFLRNLRILTLRSFLNRSSTDAEERSLNVLLCLRVFKSFPSEVFKLLDAQLMENFHLCFSVVLTSLISWFLVWPLALISTAFLFVHLFLLTVRFTSEHITEGEDTIPEKGFRNLHIFRKLSAKTYFMNMMTGERPTKIFHMNMMVLEPMMLHDLVCLLSAKFLLDNNSYSFIIIILAFISCHISQWSLLLLSNNISETLKLSKTLLNLLDMIKSPQEMLAKKNKGIKLDISGDIQLKRLCFSYPTDTDRLVLNNLNLVIKSGEKVAIYGSTRSGRTTLFKLLQKFYCPSKGSILFDSNNNIEEINGCYLRNQICSINGNPYIFPGTILENITMGLSDVPMQKVREVCKVSNAHHFIESLEQGYESVIGRDGLSLSLGQCQRIVLARALIRNPKILLLDRADVSIDTQSRDMVEKGFWKASHGKTFIVIVNSVENLHIYDKICLLDEGSIVEAGTHEELIKLQGQYAELVKMAKK